MSANISEKIIIALDVPDKQKALDLVRALPAAKMYKVGLRLFTSEGPSFIKELRLLDKKVFLDLKLHDIPNTVADTVRVCAGYGVRMMT
ncbi:MAG: orotidine 5'-phosphate decarboxylase, partial [Candidatus Aminicenantes bacterium]|nr:orotidine 5'-phosphate decarboxylase [Candidatus Aminicenantes bacterium]